MPREAHSIIITAAPQPQPRVVFEYAGTNNHFIIPPTYIHTTDQTVEQAITETITTAGYRLFPARIPLKLASARSGLTCYGRNNITYIEEMGSFYRLKAFFSDMPIEYEDWHKPRMLKQCKDCSACVKKCPTGAISGDAFIIKQDRCLTFHNERLSEFPEWIDDNWHHCLIGCMCCQTICPANRQVKNWMEDSVYFEKAKPRLFYKVPVSN